MVILPYKLALLLVIISHPWKLEYSKNGINAYTRKVDHSKYVEYKIDLTTKGDINNALNIITDLDRYSTLYPYLKSYELLSDKDNKQDFDILLNIKTPFPVRNRIGVYKNKVNWISDSEVVINISQKSDMIPENTKAVKIVDCYGSWTLKKVDSDRLHITHQFFADPGGSIPAWIINEFVLKHPVKTVKTLSKLLQEEE
jgi:hypothetical protein